MAEEAKGVEETTEQAPAGQSGVESTSVAPAEDPEAKINALLEENAKLRSDRDNYRNATLALKGKKELEELDLSDPTQVQTFIQKSIEERLTQEKVSANESELERVVKDQAKKLKELQFALANKSVVNGTAAGGAGSEPVASPKVGYFSPEQKADLEKRWKAVGIKAEKYPEMLKQAEENAKRVTPGSL